MRAPGVDPSVPRRFIFVPILLTLAGCEASAATAGPATVSTDRASSEDVSPVLVELFTSQGCSSCPPADTLLRELADDPDLPVIALSFHVDYWNYIGWEDPFSSAEWSARQRRYAHARGVDRVYTPQLLFDGVDHSVGRNASRSRAAIGHAAKDEKIQLVVEARQAGSEVVVTAESSAGTSPDATILVALVQDDATTSVRSGENARRTLHNAFIVRALTPCPEAASTCTVRFDTKAADHHVVAWMQRGSTMEILGVGLSEIATSSSG